MKKIFYLGILLGLLSACQENKMDGFDSNGAVYFQTNPSDWNNLADSVLYSFAGKDVTEKTLNLQVNLMGEAVGYDRKFRLVVDQEKTTAKVGVHYRTLEDFYILPKDAYSVQIPVILLRGDALMEKEILQLTLKLEASDDLQPGLTQRIVTRILVTDMYMKPAYWERLWMWGDYSVKKHSLLLELFEVDFPETVDEYYDDYYLWSARANMISQYVEENYPVLDENNQPIEPWFES